jgi:hypothetical protein
MKSFYPDGESAAKSTTSFEEFAGSRGVDVTLPDAMSLMRRTNGGNDAHVSPRIRVNWPRKRPLSGGLTIQDIK